MILKWGKPSKFMSAPAETNISGTYTAGSSSPWVDLPVPKEGTLNLQSQDGQETTANEEGGELVDVRYGKATYTVEWDEFDIEGKIAFEDNDGVVENDIALIIIPEDNSLPGFYAPHAKVRVTKSYNTTDGSMRHYTLRLIKPASTLKITVGGAQVSAMTLNKISDSDINWIQSA